MEPFDLSAVQPGAAFLLVKMRLISDEVCGWALKASFVHKHDKIKSIPGFPHGQQEDSF